MRADNIGQVASSLLLQARCPPHICFGPVENDRLWTGGGEGDEGIAIVAGLARRRHGKKGHVSHSPPCDSRRGLSGAVRSVCGTPCDRGLHGTSVGVSVRGILLSNKLSWGCAICLFSLRM